MDDFIHVSARPGGDSTSEAFFQNTQGKRWYTEGSIVDSIHKKYPKHHLTINPAFKCDLLAFADAREDASYSILNQSEGLVERRFVPPSRRYGGENDGAFDEKVVFGLYEYRFDGDEFLVYLVEGSVTMLSNSRYNYILVSPKEEGKDMSAMEKIDAQNKTDKLLAASTKWMQELREEVLVFDQGWWQKNKELYDNIQKAEWEDVILDDEKKQSIVDDVFGFFDGEGKYKDFGVPWKRGIIFYGPPGNGKTISTKALMHDVSKRISPTIGSLYVKTFNSFMGPEAGIRAVFSTARQMAPCLLIFEDIDSLVSPAVRSYFLNEVDGLESNHGILMIGSTNHLERLDPGIAKRPSRFDRKYLFEVPSRAERIQYAEYWRNKLKNNDKVEFPREMSARIADLTADFSFAYMKEAFVAALLVIVARSDNGRTYYSVGEDDLSGNILWKELQKQIKQLRKEREEEGEEAGSLGMMKSEFWPAMSGISDERSALSQLPTQAMDMLATMPRYG